jgi:hypothetical protein
VCTKPYYYLKEFKPLKPRGGWGGSGGGVEKRGDIGGNDVWRGCRDETETDPAALWG